MKQIYCNTVIISLKIPPQLKCVAVLPCEMSVCKKEQIVVTEVFQIVAFKTLTFHKVVHRRTGGVVRSLAMVLLQIFFPIVTVK